MDVEEVVRAIGGITLVGRLSGGEGAGAYEVVVDSGAHAVLKFDDGPHLDFERAARVTSALRARGYPAPATIATGSVDAARYALVELVRGAMPPELTPSLLAEVFELVELQRDVGLPPRAPWLEDVITSVVDGRTGYCEHAAMSAHSEETRTLLDRLRAIATAHADVDVPTDDIVHTDFHTDNMLADGDEITAVIDWEGATSGDVAFDLVTQALYAPQYRAALMDAARTLTDPRALPLYAAHMVLRQVDWSIRHHTPIAVRWYLDEGAALLEAAAAG